MSESLVWHPWSVDEVAQNLPTLAARLQSTLEALPDENKNNEETTAVLKGLGSHPVTVRQLIDRSRTQELFTLAYGLTELSRQRADAGDPAESLRLLHSAHEIFRAVNP